MDPEKQALYAQLPDGNADLRITGRFPAMLKEQQASAEKVERNVGNNEAQVIAAVRARVALITAKMATKLSESDVLLVAVYACLVDIGTKNTDIIAKAADIATQVTGITTDTGTISSNSSSISSFTADQLTQLNNAKAAVTASSASAPDKATINGLIDNALNDRTGINTNNAAIATAYAGVNTKNGNISTDRAAIVTDTSAITTDVAGGETNVGLLPIRENGDLRSKVLQLLDLLATVDPAIQQGTKS